MINLFEMLKEYKNITEDIIKALEVEEYDLLNKLLEKRDIIIENIGEVEDKNSFFEIAKELKLLELENNIKKLFDEKYEKIKNNLRQVKEQKKINTKYQTKEPIDSIFIYKKL